MEKKYIINGRAKRVGECTIKFGMCCDDTRAVWELSDRLYEYLRGLTDEPFYLYLSHNYGDLESCIKIEFTNVAGGIDNVIEDMPAKHNNRPLFLTSRIHRYVMLEEGPYGSDYIASVRVSVAMYGECDEEGHVRANRATDNLLAVAFYNYYQQLHEVCPKRRVLYLDNPSDKRHRCYTGILKKIERRLD